MPTAPCSEADVKFALSSPGCHRRWTFVNFVIFVVPIYSHRNATIGSTRDARHAGTRLASAATRAEKDHGHRKRDRIGRANTKEQTGEEPGGEQNRRQARRDTPADHDQPTRRRPMR